MENHYKILIVDDEIDILDMLSLQFCCAGYHVDTAQNSQEALVKLAINPDIILLDINMPGTSGIELCTMIRDYISCPIIFLTARVSNQDKVNGLMAGGDDYITKPFSMDELFARIASHLRREQRQKSKMNGRFYGDLIIDYGKHQLFIKNQEVEFSNKEFEIIKFLSMNAGQVFAREMIYEKLWGLDGAGDSKVIKEHIRKIRLKLSAYTDKEYLETVWGVGYRWKK